MAALRVGIGFDRHRLEPGGRPIVVAGVPLEHALGVVAHSDGDVLLHALTDAILGAIGGTDIGTLFPDDAPENTGRASRDFVLAACEMAARQGWRLVNMDCVVLLERPRLAPLRERIRQNLLALLRPLGATSLDCIGVKGKSGEGVGPVGEQRAIEAQVVVLMQREVHSGG